MVCAVLPAFKQVVGQFHAGGPVFRLQPARRIERDDDVARTLQAKNDLLGVVWRLP